MYKYCILIGRFEPLHLGHQSIIEEALKQGEKLIIVLGSHNKARSIKNPWSSEERKQMILSTLSAEQQERVKFILMRDYLYNDSLWISDIQNKINEATEDAYDSEIALVGFKSDSSSYYLDLFPNWKYISCPTDYDFHATEIRNMYFTLDANYKKCVHPKIFEFMEEFKKDQIFNFLKDEFEYIANYKEMWRGAPFPPTFVTIDAVVIKSGHILLVKRGKSLGKGLLALPGGFLNQDEKIQDGCVRELKEETAIKVSKEDLRKAIIESKVFDHPSRSNRGRVISHVFLINLGSGPLDKVKGMDDADRAFWLPLNEALSRENEFFEDHYHILNYFVNRL